MAQYILSLDQGTTSSRAIIFNHAGTIQATAQEEFQQFYPKTGWVEHDPMEIWETQLKVATEVLAKANISSESIAAIGITNQRETTIIWDKTTGKPIHNAIVWQDRRTASICDELKSQGRSKMFQEKTGLIIDAYFSGTKIKWLLDNVEGARQKALDGRLAFGTVDSWLIWNLTRGQHHITDVTNASRTLLFNIHSLEWDQELLNVLDIPKAMLPEVKASSEVYGSTSIPEFSKEIPIAGIAGDQQAALFGQMCLQPGMVKNTYGTGCFVVMNTGEKPIPSTNNLLTTIAWKIGDQVHYALEGSIFIAGAIVQWLRDEIGLIKSSEEIEKLANSVEDNGDVYLVPALSGLGAPHWDPYARGTLTGITRGTKAGHIARAALEGIAFQTMDVIGAMENDAKLPIKELRVDGGASMNNTLMQFQSDILQVPVLRPVIFETTALGAAYLAGLAVNYWESTENIQELWQIDREFHPKTSREEVKHIIHYWQKAIERSKNWVE